MSTQSNKSGIPDLSKRTFLGLLAAAAAALLGRRAVPPLPFPVTVAGKTFVPPDYAKLMTITRKAFVPRLFVQIWQEGPHAPHPGLPPDA